MTFPNANADNTPSTPCPHWCAGLHLNGRHYAELEEPSRDTGYKVKGYSIYARPTDEGDGEVGVEVVVVPPTDKDTGVTPEPIRIPIAPDVVKAAAAQAFAFGDDEQP